MTASAELYSLTRDCHNTPVKDAQKRILLYGLLSTAISLSIIFIIGLAAGSGEAVVVSLVGCAINLALLAALIYKNWIYQITHVKIITIIIPLYTNYFFLRSADGLFIDLTLFIQAVLFSSFILSKRSGAIYTATAFVPLLLGFLEKDTMVLTKSQQFMKEHYVFIINLCFNTGTILFIIYNIISSYKNSLRKLELQAAKIGNQSVELQRQSDHLQKLNIELTQKGEEAERARAESERANQAKSIFLATMSHEIRTPMNGVLGMASLLAHTPLSAEQEEYVGIINSSGEALLAIINDILDFSKIESGHLELESREFNLRQCVENVMDLFSGKAALQGIELIFQIEGKLPAHVTGDELRLRQILINLIGNALKFTYEGEVFVEVEQEERIADELLVRFSVQDTGIGVPEEKVSGLFRAFSQVDSSTTRKYGGTGLGLAISERLVKLMGGTIGVSSRAGIGSTFFFTVRLKAAGADSKVNAPADFNNKVALIVDDNPTASNVLRQQLEEWNMLVCTASSGEEALQMLREDPQIVIVLCDLQLPGMDGLELAEALASQPKDLHFILLNPGGDDLSRNAPLSVPVLKKPVKKQQLQLVLDECFNNKQKELPVKRASGVLSPDFAAQFPLTILIAEDNVVNQKLASHILGRLGYKPDFAINGIEAVEMQAEKKYDLILMDMLMPEMDGLEATRLIRAGGGKQPGIVAMTANALPGDKEACLLAGMNDYIAKPVQINILVEVLKKTAESLQNV